MRFECLATLFGRTAGGVILAGEDGSPANVGGVGGAGRSNNPICDDVADNASGADDGDNAARNFRITLRGPSPLRRFDFWARSHRRPAFSAVTSFKVRRRGRTQAAAMRGSVSPISLEIDAYRVVAYFASDPERTESTKWTESVEGDEAPRSARLYGDEADRRGVACSRKVSHHRLPLQVACLSARRIDAPRR